MLNHYLEALQLGRLGPPWAALLAFRAARAVAQVAAAAAAVAARLWGFDTSL